MRLFSYGNPKNRVFRRAINDRPYILKKTGFLDSLTAPENSGAVIFFNYALNSTASSLGAL